MVANRIKFREFHWNRRYPRSCPDRRETMRGL
jgi:hypothetical protein